VAPRADADRPATHRVAELSIALSLATDLGLGQPMKQGLSTCWLAISAAEDLDLDAATRQSVYHMSLLRFIGCTSDAAEAAELAGGDDIAFNASMAPMALARPGLGMRHFVRHLAEDLPPLRRVGRVARALADPGMERRTLISHCEVAARLAERLAVPSSVRHALAHEWERWDGRGYPAGLAGDQVPIEVRVSVIARDVEIWTRQFGWPAAAEVLAGRRGHAYDPAVVDAFLAGGEAWLAQVGDDPCAQVLDAEPDRPLTVDEAGLDDALGAIADFADLKSPCMRGHSHGVSALAADAARAAGLSEASVTDVRRAGLVHDVGRVGVPGGIWDHPGPLTSDQWERVRLHPYLTERVLRRCTLGRPFADLAAAHHERVDGSGYYRHVGGDELDLAARLLAAADVYHAMREARPHRPALDPSDAASELVAEVEAGRFGTVEVDAVLEAAGQPSRVVEIVRPAGLTEREIDVLRLIARGHTNRSAAAELDISPKTVGHHVEHIYTKCGVTTRAGATLFAMEHDLLTS
jgi:HD-GYP domain-containing protein (c-di-GMP phosphodiesterase class II)